MYDNNGTILVVSGTDGYYKYLQLKNLAEVTIMYPSQIDVHYVINSGFDFGLDLALS